MREVFDTYRPRARARATVEQANAIFDEYAGQGFTLTLRQLYYQFVARGLEENTMAQYKRLGVVLRDARDGGLVDWNAIEDRTRQVNTHSSWDDPAEFITPGQYQEDLWANQRYRPEVWVEKEALVGVIEGVCTEYRVPYFAHRGNNSQTLQYQAGKRFAEYLNQGLTPVVLYLADHDPNGIDMTRDNRERLALYAGQPVEVRRIALNLDQVQRYKPPPSFVKEGDTRTSGYTKQFGTDECWELDALSPTIIADLIRAQIQPMIDDAEWMKASERERQSREQLKAVTANWAKVVNLVATT
ncbi:hypothetical protein [Bradyrhizobium elkanii]|uniref:hypothetical protein n=1 Tax=Bradyrhizobium elkanii TaxID=29448 RepID=UPI002227AC49|nr:hypothetical protein [Bradyrhizobium elkanii]MCW2110471.1 hypothetical protein [Bradyrhizobium elkanii]WLB68245.1 hypothetical protein QIH89_23080 [Bradyrhizobium elkanii]